MKNQISSIRQICSHLLFSIAVFVAIPCHSQGSVVQGIQGIDDNTRNAVDQYLGSARKNYVDAKGSNFSGGLLSKQFRFLTTTPSPKITFPDGSYLLSGCEYKFCQQRAAVLLGSDGKIIAVAFLYFGMSGSKSSEENSNLIAKNDAGLGNVHIDLNKNIMTIISKTYVTPSTLTTLKNWMSPHIRREPLYTDQARLNKGHTVIVQQYLLVKNGQLVPVS